MLASGGVTNSTTLDLSTAARIDVLFDALNVDGGSGLELKEVSVCDKWSVFGV